MKYTNDWLLSKVIPMLKGIPQNAYTAYVSTDYASERIDGVSYWVEFDIDYITADGAHTVHAENLTDLKHDLKGVHYIGQPTADEPTQDEPQTADEPQTQTAIQDEPHPQTIDGYTPLGAVQYADDVKFTNVTGVKPSNDKHVYKPVEDDGTPYANTLYRFVYYMRAVRSKKPRWKNFDINTPCFINALYALSNMVVASVLKKIYHASANKTILTYRALDDVHDLYCTAYASEHATQTRHKKDGTQYTEIIDADLNEYEKTALKNGLSERMNMVQHTATWLIEYCAKLSDAEIIKDVIFDGVDYDAERDGEIVNGDKFGGDGKPHRVNFMTRPLVIKRPNKRVYFTDLMNDNKNKTGSSSVHMVRERTTLLQMLHRVVRDYIDDNDSKIALSRKYYYIDMEVTDADGNTIECYERTLQYTERSFDGGILINRDGKKTIAHGDSVVIDDYIQRMELTAPQTEILKYRLMSGGAYGYKAIATATGRTASTVKSIMRGIRVKAEKIGLKSNDNVCDDNTAIQGARDGLYNIVDTFDAWRFAIDNIYCMSYRQPTDSRTAWTEYSTVNTYTAKYRQSYNARAVLVGTAVQHKHFTDDDTKMPYIKAVTRKKYDITAHDKHAPNIAFTVDVDFEPIDISLDGVQRPRAVAVNGTVIKDGVHTTTNNTQHRIITSENTPLCAPYVPVLEYSTTNHDSRTKRDINMIDMRTWTDEKIMIYARDIFTKRGLNHTTIYKAPRKKKRTDKPLDATYTRYNKKQYTDDSRQAAVQTAVQPYTIQRDADGVNHIKYDVYDMRDAVRKFMAMTQTQRADMVKMIQTATAPRPQTATAK